MRYRLPCRMLGSWQPILKIFRMNWPERWNARPQAVVAVHARPRINSSGIVWRKNLILTSSEGIRFEEGIQVLLPDGRRAEARLRGTDPGTDLALLETDTGGIQPIELGSDEHLKTGQLVLAVGRTAATGPIASFGVISGVSGEWKSWRSGKLNPFVRLDVSVYPTSSGGAAVDSRGASLAWSRPASRALPCWR